MAHQEHAQATVTPGSIVILDCGGQYAHLIANRVRRLGAFSEVRVAETPAAELQGAAGIILSGGPQSVYDRGSPEPDEAIFALNIPILGICFGHQWLAHTLGGEVKPGKTKEYGHADIKVIKKSSPLLKGIPPMTTVWMSHGDEVKKLPPDFEQTAESVTCKNAAMEHSEKKIFGTQFHLEVTHTERGMDMLKNFVALCDHAPWSVSGFEERITQQITEQVGAKKKVFMLVSGGVDSTVAFTLLNKVLGTDRVHGLLIDTGLMRKNEVALIQTALKAQGITNLHVEDASEEFFAALEGIVDPEEKRQKIGDTFLAVQARVSEAMDLSVKKGWLLGQGTIYPDTIETGGTTHADHIKTHHNRVPAIEAMIEKGLVIEPLKELYKDEVRELGKELRLPDELIGRHPFPGPGLAVRILCAVNPSPVHIEDPEIERRSREDIPVMHAALPIKSVGVQGDARTYKHPIVLFSHHTFKVTPEHKQLATLIPNTIPVFNRVMLCTSHAEIPDFVFTPGTVTRSRADLLREADAIVDDEIRRAHLYDALWQFPVALLPLGTSPDGQSIVLRPVHTIDGMTADAVALPEDVLARITRELLGITGIDAVFLDLTNKPPGTIEWE